MLLNSVLLLEAQHPHLFLTGFSLPFSETLTFFFPHTSSPYIQDMN